MFWIGVLQYPPFFMLFIFSGGQKWGVYQCIISFSTEGLGAFFGRKELHEIHLPSGFLVFLNSIPYLKVRCFKRYGFWGEKYNLHKKAVWKTRDRSRKFWEFGDSLIHWFFLFRVHHSLSVAVFVQDDQMCLNYCSDSSMELQCWYVAPTCLKAFLTVKQACWWNLTWTPKVWTIITTCDTQNLTQHLRTGDFSKGKAISELKLYT